MVAKGAERSAAETKVEAGCDVSHTQSNAFGTRGGPHIALLFA